MRSFKRETIVSVWTFKTIVLRFGLLKLSFRLELLKTIISFWTSKNYRFDLGLLKMIEPLFSNKTKGLN